MIPVFNANHIGDGFGLFSLCAAFFRRHADDRRIALAILQGETAKLHDCVPCRLQCEMQLHDYVVVLKQMQLALRSGAAATSPTSWRPEAGKSARA